MKVGIVVPTLNRYRKTARFMDALSTQTYKNFHLYIVDSGSKDGTRMLAQHAPVPCTLINATLDDWWSACTNMGVKQAIADGCEVLLTINDDSIIMPNYLEKFLDVFQRNNLRICANRIDYAHEPGKIWALGSYSVWGSALLFQLRLKDLWEDQLPEDIKSKEIFPSMGVCGDGVLVHKSVYDDIGLYQERYTPQVHGDSEFIMRAWKHGIKVFVATQVVLYNDIFNLSEDGPESTKRKSLYKVIKELFFHEKSNLYWKPIFYNTWTYAPKKYFIPTILKFYLVQIYMHVLPRLRIAQYFKNSVKRTRSNTRKKITVLNKLKSYTFKKALSICYGLGRWVYHMEKVDEHTKENLIKDTQQRKRVENYYRQAIGFRSKIS